MDQSICQHLTFSLYHCLSHGTPPPRPPPHRPTPSQSVVQPSSRLQYYHYTHNCLNTLILNQHQGHIHIFPHGLVYQKKNICVGDNNTQISWPQSVLFKIQISHYRFLVQRTGAHIPYLGWMHIQVDAYLGWMHIYTTIYLS